MNQLQSTAMLALGFLDKDEVASLEKSINFPTGELVVEGLVFLCAENHHSDRNEKDVKKKLPSGRIDEIIVFSREMTKNISSAEKAIFFVVSKDEIDCTMEYACLSKSTAFLSALMLQNVLWPLLLQNSLSNSVMRSSLLESHIHKFTDSVQRASKQMEESARLSVPSIRIEDIDSSEGELISLLETEINNWSGIVSKRIFDERGKRPDSQGPLADVEFWTHRHAVLSDLEEQIQRPAIQTILRKLRAVRNSVVLSADEHFHELSELAAEAADNANFLSTLERHFRTLVEGTISTIICSISPLFDSLRMVWTVSKYYSLAERFLPLMGRISYQLAAKAKSSINIGIIFRCPQNAYVAVEAARMLETWHAVYRQVRKQIAEEGLANRRWEFERALLFDHTDYVASVLRELNVVAITIDQFQRFLESDVCFVIKHSDDILAVSSQVNSLAGIIENVDYDIFDKKHEGNWKLTLHKVGLIICNTDRAVGICIERAFQSLSSAEAALVLIENFRNVNSRKEIHSRVEEHRAKILELYSRELSDIEKHFQAWKVDPPISKIYPFKAGAIAWSFGLYQQAKRPILRFKSHEGLLTTSIGNTIKQKYLAFARSVDLFRDGVLNDWGGIVASTVTEGLERTLIVESNDDWPGRILASSLTLLRSNFSCRIMKLVREAKYLSLLGIKIPDEALMVSFQEESFRGYISRLNAILNARNQIIRNSSAVERQLLKTHFSRLDEVFKPGLTILNWTSLRIPAFLSSCSKALEGLKSILSDVQKHAGDAEVAVQEIASSVVFDQLDFNSCSTLGVLEFVELAEGKRQERVKLLVYRYRSIKPLMLKIEMAVTESDTGNATNLEEYYAYWERRLYNALVAVVIRTLENVMIWLRRQSFEHECLCCVNIWVKANSSETSVVPSLPDIQKYMNSFFTSIPGSCRQFIRWMRGSCLEMPPQTISDGIYEEIFEYSFFEDVSRNVFVKNMIIRLHEEVRHQLYQVHEELRSWLQYDLMYGLRDEEKRSSLEKLIDDDPSCSLLEGNMERFERLELFMQSFLANELSSTSEAVKTHRPISTKFIGIFFVDFSDLARWILNQALQWKLDYGQILYSTAKTRLETILQQMQMLSDAAEQTPTCLVELLSLLNTIASVSNINADMQLALVDIKYRFDTLFQYKVHVNAEEVKTAHLLETHWNDVVQRSRTKDLRLFDAKEKFRNETRLEVDQFLKTLEESKRALLESSSSHDTVRLEEGIVELEDWKMKLEEMNLKKSELLQAEYIFGLSVSSFSDLAVISIELEKLSKIYDIYNEIRSFKKLLAAICWENVNLEEALAETAKFEKLCAVFEGDQSSVLVAVQRYIASFRESLRLALLLKNEYIQPRHWEKLAIIAGRDFDQGMYGKGSMPLREVFHMDLEEYSDHVVALDNEALQERKIEVSLSEIRNYWDAVKLEVKIYEKDGVHMGYLLKTSDAVVTQIEDHLLFLQAMSSSRYAGVFLEEGKLWERSLNTIMTCLEVWFAVQRKLIYLDGIFGGCDDIRHQLPDEAKKFDSAVFIFCNFTKSAHDDPTVLKVCLDEKRIELLHDLSERLDRCQKGLSEYLAGKRNLFARFYFISDDELLSILGSPNPCSVQLHLPKLFESVQSIEFSMKESHVTSMTSREGETFGFINSVLVNGSVDLWMTAVEDEMKASLWAITKEFIFRYASQERRSWVSAENTIGMTSTCCSQVWWTWEVEDCFSKLASGDKNAMKKLESKWTNQLADMVSMVQSPLDAKVRKKVNNLLVVDVHAKDVISGLIRESVISSKQFGWQSQLRFYWDREEDYCIIKQCIGYFHYGFEYTGLSSRLVITTLTDRCFLTLTQALALKLGGAPAGPAGTGKTETVKDLAKALALACFVINCGDGLNYLSMGAIFSGLVQVGAWGCFDEFNRLNIEVLSVVSSQLKAIQNALLHDSPSVNIGTGSNLMVKRIKGLATVGVFITMNPGYAGRTELPQNLQILFRPVAMISPDLEKIAENILFSEGFNESKVLATKIVALYKFAKNQLSKQCHYDFGLRAIKTTLVIAGGLKRQFSELSEEHILIKILIDTNLPKLVFEDLPLFLGLVNDIFPGKMCPEVNRGNFTSVIASDLEKNGFRCSDDSVHACQVEKIIQFHETQQTRHTTMLVGPSGGGKSTIIKTLASAREQCEGIAVKKWVLNPKAQTINELYGILDPVTHDWSDGILSKIFRDVNQPLPTRKTNEVRWIIFDGDVDALWVENLNSVMDDNRVLTLPNRERIRLLPHCALICEVADLLYASPATVSRCGMVWVDPKNLGFRPYFERWTRNRLVEDADVVTHSKDSRFTETKHLNFFFHKYIPSSIEYVMKGMTEGQPRDKLVQLVTVSEIELCKQLCSMLDAFLPRRSSRQLKCSDMEAIFLYCVIWSVGAHLDQLSRTKFDMFIKALYQGPVPENNIMYSLYYDIDACKWKSWDHRVQPFQEPRPYRFYKVTVQTKATAILQSMLQQVGPLRPLMFAGESGTRKTSTIESFVATLRQDTFSRLDIKMSFRTSSLDVQRNIEANIEKITGNLYGARNGKMLVVFIDDLNMASVDRYGTQEPVALLLTLLDHGFMFSRAKDLSPKVIKNLQCIVASSTPGNGRTSIDTRFVSRFNVLGLTEPDYEELFTIFDTIIKSRLSEFDHSIKECTSKLTEATIRVFQSVREHLAPTPSKFHYIYNLKDISRVCEGICSVQPENVKNDFMLVRLWYHEISRVFFDRLIAEEDRRDARARAEDIALQLFPESAMHSLREDIVFGDFENVLERITVGADDARMYCDLGDFAKIRMIFSEVLRCYNDANDTKLTLSLFDMALSHLVRLMRILKTPRGHALLIGIGGSGKRSLTKLASFANGFDLFELKLTRGYKESNFRDDLKELYLKLSVGPTVFLFSDCQIVDESFLEYVNNILCTGSHPGLFSSDEKEKICILFREQAKDLSFEIDDASDALWQLFLETCRSNIHIVLAMSPSGDKLRLRCRKFPGFISACTIDWFLPWPNDALEQIAATTLMGETNLFRCVDINQVLRQVVSTHELALATANHYQAATQRSYSITPKHFLDFIRCFKEHLYNNSNKVNASIKRLNGGLGKLNEVAINVDRMKVELKLKKEIVDSKTSDVEEILRVTSLKTAIAMQSNEEASLKEVAMEDQAKKIIFEKHRADSSLMEALPAIEAASEALNNIRREDLQELKSFNNPPLQVKIVCQMCAVFRPTGEKLDDSWVDCRKILGNVKLLDLLKAYPKDNITEKMYRSCTKILTENERHEITVENLGTVSKAGAGLLVWVLAILRYYEVLKHVEPLRETVKLMENAQVKTEAELLQLRELLCRLQSELKNLDEAYVDAKKELAELQSQAMQLEKRLISAYTITDGLAEEGARWSRDMTDLEKKHDLLVGDSLLAASFLSYFGPFDANYRHQYLNCLLKEMSCSGLHHSENAQAKNLLTTDVMLQRWSSKGLSNDDYSVQNGILTTMGMRFPLCVDPQQQAASWIKSYFSDENLIVKTVDDIDFLKHLELAIRFGKPFLFENVLEAIDPVLDHVLERAASPANGSAFVSLGGKMIEWNNSFRLFLCTKLRNPTYTPEIAGKVSLINFCITRDCLTDQLLNIVVQHEKPELQQHYQVLVNEMAFNCDLLRGLEDSLLQKLSSSNGDILENDNLILTLDKTKLNAIDIESKIESARGAQAQIQEMRSAYQSVATRGSLLYFASSGLSRINSMYELSLAVFLKRFGHALDGAQHDVCLEKRIINLAEFCTKSVYDFVVMGIFEKHRLAYSFYLACMVLEEAGKLERATLDLFFRGNCSVNSVTDKKPSSLYWLPETGWRDFIALALSDEDFSKIKESLITFPNNFKRWFDLEAPEKCKPVEGDLSLLKTLCLVRVFRPDRCYNAMQLLVEQILGCVYARPQEVDVKRVFEQSTPLNPVLFIVSPGTNPERDIQQLGVKLGVTTQTNFRSISLGQGQGPLALKMLQMGYSRGHWVLIQNCHLLTEWTRDLENILEAMKSPHTNFRLWLTTEATHSFPLGVLQKSVKVVTEPPSSMKLNMRSLILKIDESLIQEKKPDIYNYLVFIFIYLHAVLQERRKYGKLGWNVNYDFNDGDLFTSRKLLSFCLTNMDEGNGSIPWESLKYLIGECIYGGRVSDEMDRRILLAYLEEYAGDFIFDRISKFYLSREGFDCCLPSAGTETSSFLELVNAYPATNSPQVLGMHPNAEISYFIKQSRDLWKNLISLQPATEVSGIETAKEETISSIVCEILTKLPCMTPDVLSVDLIDIRKNLKAKNANGLLTPCQLVLLQELDRWNSLCTRMSTSLLLLRKAIAGEILMTDRLEEVGSSLYNGLVPMYWKALAPDTEKKLDSWIVNFSQRWEQYLTWIRESELAVAWLGGLHNPESYLAAAVQTVFRQKRWPLDQHAFYTCVTKFRSPEDLKASSEIGVECFYISGLFLEGAGWDFENSCLKRQEARILTTELPLLRVVPIESRKSERHNSFRTPVYTTSARGDAPGSTLVFEADLTSHEHSSIWTLQGVALVLNTSD